MFKRKYPQQILDILEEIEQAKSDMLFKSQDKITNKEKINLKNLRVDLLKEIVKNKERERQEMEEKSTS